ncbi:hypothetical protein NPIL_460441 [Nephila pilipes]|uniref:Uncharacterized protein n=1 Tax=Nephila pilipes TaxID=299642 RepID=A0A8X6PCS0_NEPPI|nr:hypothetical protein NPIL_460441 [Nephila pilipes]
MRAAICCFEFRRQIYNNYYVGLFLKTSGDYRFFFGAPKTKSLFKITRKHYMDVLADPCGDWNNISEPVKTTPGF